MMCTYVLSVIPFGHAQEQVAWTCVSKFMDRDVCEMIT